jgi:hypothetical protein
MTARMTTVPIALDPGTVDGSKYPRLSAMKLRGVLAANRDRLADQGIDVHVCFVDPGSSRPQRSAMR